MDVGKSLDDLIKQESAQRKATRTTSTRGRGARGRGRGRGRGGRGAGRGAAVPRVTPIVGTQRPVSIRGAGRPRRGTPRSPGARTMPDKWQHDLFQGGRTQPAPRVARGAAHSSDLREMLLPAANISTTGTLAKKLGSNGLTTGTKLLVTNLESSVTKEDMRELFQECGPLKRVDMPEVGVAEVVFSRRVDAVKAQTTYNKVKLDGRPMYLQVEEAAPTATAVAPTKSKGGAARRGPRKVQYTVKV
ncbi:hypothetical protein PTSG_03838 [Salpingoeca rosetta]|uniref:RRM domain-containing protein n=1 Tax=Salpingoeca rosetta (strain ATCC 50818 / BSB-021) TaxID=946362 RepID=F2U5J2_SALR5|nr:uncharacterized protein PTSG_03838 [Salpingoeca rosetta]EGD83208.1 hypothetical protein PTSG_03838 [Salpingoeca rosetta]|eukprot:XP_004995572.1 hypothetical protein PTSG_03838 [Salpingoeca rosetta]